MLRLLHIDGFKAYAAQSIPFEGCNVLVGSNGSGKTSVLQAIEFFRGLVRSDLARQLESHRWAYRDLPHLASPNQEFGFGALLELEGAHLWWSVRLGKRRYENIAAEEVRRLTPNDVETVLADGVPTAAHGELLMARTGTSMHRLDREDGEWESVRQTLTNSWLSTLSPDDAVRYPELLLIAAWARAIEPYVVLDPNRLREPSGITRTGIGVAGGRLAGFLRYLRSNRPGAFERVFGRAKRAYPRLSELTIRQDGSAYSLSVRESWSGSAAGPLLNARQASDGLLRLFALAALPETQPRPTLVMIDEIENGVHPELLGALMTMLEDLNDDGIQVITTSHSPLVVNYVTEPESILLTTRGPNGEARVERLSDTPGYANLSSVFSKGEMWLARGEAGLINPSDPHS